MSYSLFLTGQCSLCISRDVLRVSLKISEKSTILSMQAPFRPSGRSEKISYISEQNIFINASFDSTIFKSLSTITMAEGIHLNMAAAFCMAIFLIQETHIEGSASPDKSAHASSLQVLQPQPPQLSSSSSVYLPIFLSASVIVSKLYAGFSTGFLTYSFSTTVFGFCGMHSLFLTFDKTSLILISSDFFVELHGPARHPPLHASASIKIFLSLAFTFASST